MLRFPVLSRRARWAVPGGAVAAVAAVTAATTITIAQAAPALPARTPAQLLAEVAGHMSAPPPFTATVVETAALGIPQLPGAADPTSITSLLAGSHTLKIWYVDPAHMRLAAPVTMGETDFIHNGSTAWLWQSGRNSVTKFELPPGSGPMGGLRHAAPVPSQAPLTPQQAAQRALAAVGRSTSVTTQSNVMVAGQAAYQLVLAPRDHRSLIGKITIALDGQHPNVALRVQVFARGATSPAFQIGFTSISFVTPAAVNFSFTPPPGSTVRVVTVPGAGWGGFRPSQLRQAGAHRPQVIGKGWLSVAVLPASALSALASGGPQAARVSPGQAAGQAARSLSSQGGGPGAMAILAVLLQSAHPVHGAWGSGRLLRMSLVSILITSDGHMLLGAVTPGVLYAAAAQVK